MALLYETRELNTTCSHLMLLEQHMYNGLASTAAKAVTRGVFWVLKHPPKLIANFLVSQLCLFVQQNIFRLRLLNIGVCLNYLKCTKTQ